MERAGENAEAFGVDDNLVKASFRLRIELHRIEQREPRSWTNAAEVPYGLVG